MKLFSQPSGVILQAFAKHKKGFFGVSSNLFRPLFPEASEAESVLVWKFLTNLQFARLLVGDEMFTDHLLIR